MPQKWSIATGEEPGEGKGKTARNTKNDRKT